MLKKTSPAIVLALFASMLTPATAAQADPVTSWTLQASLSPSEQWSGVSYADGLYFASAKNSQSNSLMFSTDAANWSMNYETYVGDSFNGITVCNSNAVEVGDYQTFEMDQYGSGSGATGLNNPALGNTWNAVTCSPDNTLVAVGSESNSYRVITSTNGYNWTGQTAPALDWTSVTYGGGRYVAVASSGNGNRVMTSTDGINWISRQSAADNAWTSVTFGNGLFVAVAKSGHGDRVMTSPDGINWTSRASAADNDWTSVAYGNGQFMAVSSNSNSTGLTTSSSVMESTDGINWTSLDSPAQTWTGITYGNGLFVAVSSDGGSQQVMTSTFGGTLTASKTTLISTNRNGATAKISTTYPKNYLVGNYFLDADSQSYCYNPSTPDHFMNDQFGPIRNNLEDINAGYTCSGRTTWVIKIFDPNNADVIAALNSNYYVTNYTVPFNTPSLASVTIEIYPGTFTTISCDGGGSYDIDSSGVAFNGGTCAGDLNGTLALDPTVTEVASYGFYHAPLTTLIVPDSVTEIGRNAFAYSPISQLYLGSSVTAIGDMAFFQNNLTELSIPDSVQSIGNSAFFGNAIGALELGSSLVSIDVSAFEGAALTSLSIPDSVQSIGIAAFYDSPITELHLGSSLKTIGDSAFYFSLLDTLTIPDSVTQIGALAFSRSQLTSLTLGNSLQSIGQEAFNGFHGTSLVIPASVTSIDAFAFQNDNFLTSLSIYSPNISLGFDIFDSSNMLTCFNNFGGAVFTQAFLQAQMMPPICASYQIAASSGSNGSISNGAVAFVPGDTPTFTITPNSGYRVSSVTVDSSDVTGNLVAGSGQTKTYTFGALSADHTIFASFTPVSNAPTPPPPPYYNVYFTNQTGYIDQGGGTAGTVITCPTAPVRTGYTFVSWGGACSAGATYKVTANKTFDAVWIKSPVTVIFTSNGATVATQNVTPGSVIDCPAAPIRADYTFTGWPGCVDGKYTVNAASSIDAQWQKTLYSVSFTANGATLKTQNANAGSFIDCPAAPTRTGFTFTGWPGCVDGKYTVTGSASIDAQWTETPVPTPTPQDAGGGQTEQQTQQTTVTKSVFFSPDSVTLSKATIRAISDMVKAIPAGASQVASKIVGYAYPINSAAANKKISNGRASNIAALLKKLGITGNFTVIGAGRDKVADLTARRVDVAITYTTLVTAP